MLDLASPGANVLASSRALQFRVAARRVLASLRIHAALLAPSCAGVMDILRPTHLAAGAFEIEVPPLVLEGASLEDEATASMAFYARVFALKVGK